MKTLFQKLNTIPKEMLSPMDVISTRKRASTLLERIGHREIEVFQKNLFPDHHYEENHVRLVIGEFSDMLGGWETLGIEGTFPTTRVLSIEEWMISPEYGHVYRNDALASTVSPMLLLREALKHTGKSYDWVQLIGMHWNIRWLHLGKDKEVCSTLIRKIIENVTGVNIFPDIPAWRTPPCAWAHYWYPVF